MLSVAAARLAALAAALYRYRVVDALTRLAELAN